MLDPDTGPEEACQPRHIRDGVAWYQAAHSDILAACGLPELPMGPRPLSMAIAAVLSPRLPWRLNVRDAGLVWRHGAAAYPKMAALGSSRRKAIQLVLGADPGAVLSGPKVKAFYRALCGDRDAVVIDAHMFRLARWPENRRKDRDYERVSCALRRVADEVGMPARDLQAALWCYQRGRSD